MGWLSHNLWDERKRTKRLVRNDKNHLIGVRLIYTIILHIFIIQHLLFPLSKVGFSSFICKTSIQILMPVDANWASATDNGL
jgi:hypothetical protein